ncbi:Cadherin cytoplasmic C-terminal [Mactra antiquata]
MVLIWMILYFACTVSVSAEDCSIPGILFVNETAPAGTIIMNTTIPANETFTFTVKQGSYDNRTLAELTSSFRVTNTTTYAEISLTKPLDLEKFHENFTVDISTIEVMINCKQSQETVRIAVKAINEFPPVFVGAPYRIEVPESTRVNDIVFEVKNKTYDRDFGQTTNMFTTVQNFTGNVTDGQSYFFIRAVTRGDIRLKAPLDFDNDNIPKHFALNVSVRDDGGLGSHTEIYIDILDVDDQNPYFYYSGCTPPCAIPEFDAITDLHFTGILQIQPEPLEGRDDDKLNTTLLYSITSGNENMFIIDEYTAVVTQKISVSSSQLPDPSFRLILEVRKDLPQVLSSQAILVVHVKERKQNDTDYPPESTPTSNDNKTNLLIPVIILAVVATLILIACIVVSVLYRKNRKIMVVTPDKNKNKNFKNGSAKLFEKPIKSELEPDINQPVGKRLAPINGRVKTEKVVPKHKEHKRNKAMNGDVETQKTVLDENGDNNVSKTKRKRRKKGKFLRTRLDEVESTNDKDTEGNSQMGIVEPIVPSIPLPPSFNKAPPLPKIRINPIIEVERDGEVLTENKDKKEKPKYPTLTDAYNSEPPTWDTFPTTLV